MAHTQLRPDHFIVAVGSEFITQAVQEKLANGNRSQGKRWLECAGELAPLHRETRRIQKLTDEEFEQIEPEDRI